MPAQADTKLPMATKVARSSCTMLFSPRSTFGNLTAADRSSKSKERRCDLQ